MTLGIYGAGGLGREVLDLTRIINVAEEQWESFIFIDDNKKVQNINGSKVYTFKEFTTIFSTASTKVTIAVGEPKIRQMLRFKVTENGYSLQMLVHPNAFTGAETQIGEGTIIQYGCFVSCNVNIGANALLQPNTTVGHDSVIGSDSVISTYASISGGCAIGDRVYVGLSVPIKENISIGADSIIGMGSAVMRNIPENVIAIGIPARPMKNNENGRVFK